MASNLVIRVWKIEDVLKHPNADRLEIVKVGGWTCCSAIGEFKKGDLAIYFPPDTLLPKSWTDTFGCTQHCQEITEHNSGEPANIGLMRVRCAKLRQVPSFGFIVPAEKFYPRPAIVPMPPLDDSLVGLDVAAVFGARKHVPPFKCDAGDAESPHALFHKFTDVENGRNWPNVFQNGEIVNVTEKIDGTNCRLGLVRDESGPLWVAGSMEIQRKRPATEEAMSKHLYWFPYTLPNVRKLIEDLYAKGASSVFIFGETYGKVQAKRGMNYGIAGGIRFAAFDLSVDGRWIDNDEVLRLFVEYGIPVVPFLGRFEYSSELMDTLSQGQSDLSGSDHMREGIVARGAKEKHSELIGRRVLKWLNPEFVLKIAKSREELDTKDV